ncbi:SDR family oxidoreductase [Paenibacillus sp. FSL R7-0652]|uniref:SDR family oxidoreductase n=1 Tax=Paenibacillus sp. AN1007 TaxID=3151385 RepID=A0AAU8NJ94_9BACL
MQLNLTGKTALVTGATGQLGRIIARTLAACGANLALHYINNETKANELLGEIEAMGRQAVIVQGDITKQDTAFRIRDEIQNKLGGVDIVVANAVIQYEWTTVLEQAPEDYLSQFESCVMQSVYLAKAFIPYMQQVKSGRFIGINTECAMQNFAHQSAYSAGKRGMDGVYRVLAKEVGAYQITVNQVAPGWTISERDRAGEPGQDEAYTRTVPLQRRGEDQEIANAVAFLASDLSSFITGAYIPVSGGNVMPAI